MAQEDNDNTAESQQGESYNSDTGESGASDETTYGQPEGSGKSKGLLLLVLLIAVGGGGVYLMSMRAGPATAGAATVQTEANKAQTAVKMFLSDPNKRGQSLAQLLSNTQTVIERFSGYPKQNQVPLAALPGNPFKLASAASTGDATDDEAKKKIEAARMAVAKEAGSLQLQSLLVGSDKPTVLINGQSLAAGGHVAGFTVISIERDRVVVEKQSMRFALCVAK